MRADLGKRMRANLGTRMRADLQLCTIIPLAT